MGYLQSHPFCVVEFNVENLFLFLDHYNGEDLTQVSEDQWQKFSASTIPNKPLRKVAALARSMMEMDADIFMLCEVGGLESLESFCRHFLNNEYIPHLIEGNSDRGIDLGYLVRRRLPFKYELISHKNRPIDFLYPHEQLSKQYFYTEPSRVPIQSHKFSRDVLELRVYESGSLRPDLILLLVHLKSQLDRERIDPFGRDRRKAENDKLMQIYLEISNEFADQVPMIVGGDFNGNAGRPGTDPEFASIYAKTPLIDALEAAGIPPRDRVTYMQINNGGRIYARQLDYLFLSPHLQRHINADETCIPTFRDEAGRVIPPPRTLAAKQLLPSDHYAVLARFQPLGS